MTDVKTIQITISEEGNEENWAVDYFQIVDYCPYCGDNKTTFEIHCGKCGEPINQPILGIVIDMINCLM